MLLFAKLYPKKKIYLWSHGKYGKEGRLKTLVQSFFFNLADGTFLYGDYAKKIMSESGFDSSKLYVIKNSLNYDHQLQLRKESKTTGIYEKYFGNTNKVLIFIGRLTPVKHLDMLLYSVKALEQKGENYNLVFVGDGSEKIKLETLTNELNLTSKIWFYGACYDDVQNCELIYNADLCVAPGNVGLTAMHAMVFGTPVLSHNNFSWQMPEFEAIKPGVTGIFFDYMNQESLTSSISEWFEKHVSSRESVRQACYDEIDHYWNPYYQIEVLKSVIK